MLWTICGAICAVRAAAKEDIANLDDYLHRITKMMRRSPSSTSTESLITNTSLHAVVSHHALPRFFQRHARRMVHAATRVTLWTARKDRALDALGTDPVLVAVGLSARQAMMTRAQAQKEAQAARAEQELLAMEAQAETSQRKSQHAVEHRAVTQASSSAKRGRRKTNHSSVQDTPQDHSAIPAALSTSLMDDQPSATNGIGRKSHSSGKPVGEGKPLETAAKSSKVSHATTGTAADGTQMSSRDLSVSDPGRSKTKAPQLQNTDITDKRKGREGPVGDVSSAETSDGVVVDSRTGSALEDDVAWKEHRARRKTRAAAAPTRPPHLPATPRLHPGSKQQVVKETTAALQRTLPHTPQTSTDRVKVAARPNGGINGRGNDNAGVRPHVLCSPDGSIVLTDVHVCRAWLRGECSKVCAVASHQSPGPW